MKFPIPTVEQLVNVFRENNWTPQPGSTGTYPEAVSQGRCCALPSLVRLNDPNHPLENSDHIWQAVQAMYGEEATSIWNGFDFPQDYKETYLAQLIVPETRKAWYRLGRDLRLALNPKLATTVQ